MRITNIVAATDGSPHALKAVDFACSLAAQYGAGLHLLCVVPPLPLTAPAGAADAGRNGRRSLEKTADVLQRAAEQFLEQARRRALAHDPERLPADRIDGTVDQGRPAERIVACAERIGADLIVVGSRGLSDAAGLLLGSVSHRVANLAGCSCVTVR